MTTARASIRALVDTLGPSVLRPVHDDGNDHTGVVVICSIDEPFEGTVHDGDIVLAVGGDGVDGARSAVRRLGAARASAVVVRLSPDHDATVRAIAETVGISVIGADPAAAWSRLYDLLDAALAAARRPVDLPGASASRDLFALADVIADAVGGPVTIEDRASHLLAFSREGQDVDPVRIATILGRRVPDQWERRLRLQAALDGLLAGSAPGVIELDGMASRRVMPVRSGRTLLGSIWVAGPTDPTTTDEVLENAAPSAALLLLQRRAEAEAEQSAVALSIATLLTEGRLDSAALPDRGDGLAVLALDVVPSDGARSDPSLLDHVLGMLANHLRAFRRSAAHAVLDGRGYLVVGGTVAGDEARLKARLDDGIARIGKATGLRIRAGLGVPAASPDHAPLARRTADRALECGARDGVAVPFESVRATALVADVGAFVGAREVGTSAALRALRRHDHDNGTDLVKTLRATLAAFGDTARAARALHVHANTVRYRLRQAVEITGIRLTDSPSRLALELELLAGEGTDAPGEPDAPAADSNSDD